MAAPDVPPCGCAVQPCPRAGLWPWGEEVLCWRHGLDQLHALLGSVADRLDGLADQLAARPAHVGAQQRQLQLAL